MVGGVLLVRLWLVKTMLQAPLQPQQIPDA
jgi:hypothetical protein